MTCAKKKHGELLTSLLDVMQDETFTDLKLHLGDGEVVTCRSLLAAMSPVFRRMLTDPMRERDEGEITLQHMSLASWNVVVSFYLSEEEMITVENVEEIVEIAHQYDMKSLEEHCSKMLCEYVTVENCISLLEIATKYSYHDSIRRLICFMGKNFEAVSSMAQFCSLPQNQLEDLLGSSLFVTSEDSIVKAVLSWLEHNQADGDTVAQLLGLVKVEEISTDCLCTHILYHPRIVSCNALKNRVAKEIQRRCATSPSSDIVYERVPVCSSNIIILGFDGHNMHMFTSIEPLREWKTLASAEVGDGFAACTIDGFIYVTGGLRGSYQKSTFIFNMETKEWTPGPHLVQERYAHAMTKINQTLYAVAGRNGTEFLSSIEERHVASHAWATSGHLKVGACSFGVATVGSTIIVVGGRTNHGQKAIQTFDTVTRTAAVLETRPTIDDVRARGVTC